MLVVVGEFARIRQANLTTATNVCETRAGERTNFELKATITIFSATARTQQKQIVANVELALWFLLEALVF